MEEKRRRRLHQKPWMTEAVGIVKRVEQHCVPAGVRLFALTVFSTSNTTFAIIEFDDGRTFVVDGFAPRAAKPGCRLLIRSHPLLGTAADTIPEAGVAAL